MTTTESTPVPSNLVRGDGHRNPIPIVKELYERPISLMATFADCGTLYSGSRVIAGPHDEDSDFDLYQIADRRALATLVSVFNFANIQWHNRLLFRIAKDMKSFKQFVIPLKEIAWLASHLKEFCLDPAVEYKDQLKGVKEYLASELKRSNFNEYGDLPSKFCHALEICANTEEIDNKLWVYKPNEALESCVCELPRTIWLPLSRLFNAVRLTTKDEDGEIDYRSINDVKFTERTAIRVIKVWKGKGYNKQVLRRLLRFHMTNQAPWLRDEIDDIIHGLPKFGPTKVKPEKKRFDLSYKWFTVLRGTLPNKKKVQIMIIPPEKEYGVRKYGIAGTLLGFYGSHTMGGIGGTHGFHFYDKPTNEGLSYKMDFTNDIRQPHAEESITKMSKRGWTFEDMHRGRAFRSISDGQSAHVTEYEDEVYKSALHEVQKNDKACFEGWDEYFYTRSRAVHAYTWVENEGRIQDITNTTWPPRQPCRDQLSDWVHKELSDHEYVIPASEWRKRDLFRADLDVWFGGYKKALYDKMHYLL